MSCPRPTNLFTQLVKFNRALCPTYGDLYATTKKPVVERAVVVVLSNQASSHMVQQGLPYVCFITCNERFPCGNGAKFFASAEEAIVYAKRTLATHPAIVR